MSNLDKKLETFDRYVFYGIILFLPIQLGKHFWPSFSLVEGVRIDYLSPTLYLTDVLIILLCASIVSQFLIGHRVKISKKFLITNYKFNPQGCKLRLLFTLFLIVLSVGIIFSQAPLAGLYKTAKIIEFSFLAFYIAKYINLKKDLSRILILLGIGVIFESSLAIVQFLQQQSIGGIFWFFGERTFSGQTPGIANADINGQQVLRPYGTFPHPNVLAGYLVIAMTLLVSSIKYRAPRIRELFFLLAFNIGTIALLLTLSRTSILLWILISGWLLITRFIIHNSPSITRLLVFIGIIFIIALTPLLSRFTSIASVYDVSFSQRQTLNILALAMIRDQPIFGVGLNNFLITLPDYARQMHLQTSGPLWLQPVHNIFLLVAAETGLIGLGIFLWFIWKTFTLRRSSFIILCSVLFLGMFDHYFLTLQQGQLLFAFIFGFLWARQG